MRSRFWWGVGVAGCLPLLGCGATAEREDDAASTRLVRVSPAGVAVTESGEPVRAAPDTRTLEDGSVAYGEGPLTLLVVFDTSGSMQQPWGTGRSKWQVANDALLAAIAEFEDNLTVGAVKFPVDQSCGVSPINLEPQLDFRPGAQFVSDWLGQGGSPNGNTPLELGLAFADEAILAAAARGLLDHRFRVLVFSDGEPTCGDDSSAIISYPRRWLQMGIHTYVVGLPGSAPAFDLLGAMADAGGTGVAAGGGPAIANDPDNQAQAVYAEGSAENNNTSTIVVDDEDELAHVTRASVR